MQSQIDLALNPRWGNTAQQVTRIRVPKGTTIFEGAAAADGRLLGGGSQVFIPSPTLPPSFWRILILRELRRVFRMTYGEV
jgi:hypothetical protein